MYFEGILSLTKFRKVFVKRLQASSSEPLEVQNLLVCTSILSVHMMTDIGS